MIFFLNKSFSEKTPIFKALIQIEGIGTTSVKQILDCIYVSNKMKIGNLSSSQLSKIKQILDQNYYINQELRTFNNNNIKRLGSIGSYRGLRHSLGLPLRGQRTHTTAKTCRKRNKVVSSARLKEETKTRTKSKRKN